MLISCPHLYRHFGFAGTTFTGERDNATTRGMMNSGQQERDVGLISTAVLVCFYFLSVLLRRRNGLAPGQ